MGENKRLPSIAEFLSGDTSTPRHQAVDSPKLRWRPVQQTPPVDIATRSKPRSSASLVPLGGSAPSSTANVSSWRAVNHRDHSSSSPPQKYQQDLANADKPIAARRQDSAVAGLPASSSASSSLQTMFPSAHHLNVQSSTGLLYQTTNPGGGIDQPTTPPSPAPSPDSHLITAQSRFARPRTLVPGPRRQESPPCNSKRKPNVFPSTYRNRAYSDPNASPLSSSSSSTLSPRLVDITKTPASTNMPPPPNPAFSTPNSMSMSDLIEIARTQDPEEITRQLRLATETSSHPESAQSSHLNVIESEDSDLGNPTAPRCVRCGEAWHYPAPDPSLFQHGPSNTREELGTGTEAFLALLRQHGKKQDEAYYHWERQHQVKPGDSGIDPPCVLAGAEASASMAVGNKRKSDILADDGQMALKLRRLSCKSPSPKPPQLAPKPPQLTPPPEPSISPSQDLPGGLEVRPRYELTLDDVKAEEQLAVILGQPGARPPIYEPPSNDASNMWATHLPEQRSKSVESGKKVEDYQVPRGDVHRSEQGAAQGAEAEA